MGREREVGGCGWMEWIARTNRRQLIVPLVICRGLGPGGRCGKHMCQLPLQAWASSAQPWKGKGKGPPASRSSQPQHPGPPSISYRGTDAQVALAVPPLRPAYYRSIRVAGTQALRARPRPSPYLPVDALSLDRAACPLSPCQHHIASPAANSHRTRVGIPSTSPPPPSTPPRGLVCAAGGDPWAHHLPGQGPDLGQPAIRPIHPLSPPPQEAF